MYYGQQKNSPKQLVYIPDGTTCTCSFDNNTTNFNDEPNESKKISCYYVTLIASGTLKRANTSEFGQLCLLLQNLYKKVSI